MLYHYTTAVRIRLYINISECENKLKQTDKISLEWLANYSGLATTGGVAPEAVDELAIIIIVSF